MQDAPGRAARLDGASPSGASRQLLSWRLARSAPKVLAASAAPHLPECSASLACCLHRQPPAQIRHVAASDRDRVAVGERELGGPPELGAELDGLVEVGHVLAVHAHEPEPLPASLD